MPDEVADHIADVRDELDVEQQRFERARDRAGARVASDASRTVQVHTDAEGRVTQVSVDAAWRDRLTVDALPGAVLEAYQQGVTERAEAWAGELSDPAAEEPRVRPAAGIDSSGAAQLMNRIEGAGDDVDDRVVMERMLDVLTQLDRAMDDALDDADRRATEEHTGRSSSRHVVATVSGGGDLVGLEYDERWLADAHSFNVGRETTEAVTDAVRANASAGERAAAASPMASLLRFADDPASFAEHLGLDGR